jgi:hypothetical protein
MGVLGGDPLARVHPAHTVDPLLKDLQRLRETIDGRMDGIPITFGGDGVGNGSTRGGGHGRTAVCGRSVLRGIPVWASGGTMPSGFGAPAASGIADSSAGRRYATWKKRAIISQLVIEQLPSIFSHRVPRFLSRSRQKDGFNCSYWVHLVNNSKIPQFSIFVG